MPIEAELEALIARELRRSIGLDGRSLEALGREAGFSSGYLSQLLRGRQHLKVRHIGKVLRALGLRPSEFFRRVVNALGDQPDHLSAGGQFTSTESLHQSSPQPATEKEGPPVVEKHRQLDGLKELRDLEGMVRKIVRQELGQALPLGQIPVKAESGSRRVLEDEPRGQQPPLKAGPLEAFRTQEGLTESEFRAKVRQAEGWLQELLKVLPEERREKASNAHVKYRGPVFYLLTLEEARRHIPGAPKQALSLADAVIAVLEKIAGDYPPDPEIQAPALAVRGNAKRALGRIRAAEVDLLDAKELLESSGVSDRATAAEVHAYLGSLRKDQGHLEEAVHHLTRAATLYGLLGDREKAGRELLTLGTVHYRRHDLTAAVESDERALELLDEGSEPWLRGYARYNLAFHLHSAGDTDRAEEELKAHEDLLASAGDEVVQHVAWLRGRIAWSRGELPAAKRRFTEARKRARERGAGYDAGLITLELALVHLAEGRTDRVKSLADQGLRSFAREEFVERETRAALELLEAAARREALDRQALEQAVTALERARHGRRPAARRAP